MAAPQLQHSAAAEALHLAPEGAADAAQLHHHAIFWLGSADAGQITAMAEAGGVMLMLMRVAR